MQPFAKTEDLTERLGRTPDDSALAQTLLDDASEHIRGIIGQAIYPPTQATFTTMLRNGEKWITLPAHPVVSIDSVESDGAPVPYTHVDGALRVQGHAVVDVTYTFGYQTPPRDLVSWACVLASQAMSSLEEMGTLGSGGVSSVSIDDYRKSWADGGASSGFSLPQRVADMLRSRYGQATFVVSSR